MGTAAGKGPRVYVRPLKIKPGRRRDGVVTRGFAAGAGAA